MAGLETNTLADVPGLERRVEVIGMDAAAVSQTGLERDVRMLLEGD